MPSTRLLPLALCAALAGCAMPEFDAPAVDGTGVYPQLLPLDAVLAGVPARDRDAEAAAAAAFEARLGARRAPGAADRGDAAALEARLIALRARAEALRARDLDAE